MTEEMACGLQSSFDENVLAGESKILVKNCDRTKVSWAGHAGYDSWLYPEPKP